MRADLELDVEEPGKVRKAVSPSLRSSDKVGFDTSAGEKLEISVESKKLGSLRGGANTALMLTRLATKFMEKKVK